MQSGQTDGSRGVKPLTKWLAFSGMGFEVAACVGAGAWVGMEIDGRLGSKPVALVAGTLLGTIAAFVRVIWYLRWMNSLDGRNGSGDK